MKKKLTVPFIQTLKLKPGEKPYDIGDSECPGLAIRVGKNGLRWTFVYWCRIENKSKRLKLGPYPKVTLAKAHEDADQARLDNVRMDDPKGKEDARRATLKVEAEAKKNEPTYTEVVTRFIDEHAKPRNRTWAAQQSELTLIGVKMGFTERPFTSITELEIDSGLYAVVQGGHPAAAINHFKALKSLYRWACQPKLKLGLVNQMLNIRTPAESNNSDRRLTGEEIKVFWEAMQRRDLPRGVGEDVAEILQLILVTGRRPGEICGLKREEVATKSNCPWLEFGADRMKNKLSFVGPVNNLAIELLNRRLRYMQPDDAYLFPTRNKRFSKKRKTFTKHWTVNSLSNACRAIVKHLGVVKFTPHDLRRTAATIAGRCGADPTHIDYFLSHYKAKSVGATYNQYRYLDKKADVARILDAGLRRAIMTGVDMDLPQAA